MSTATQNSLALEMPSDTYLNSSYGVKSWFLTGDHKRIAMMYVVSISLMFLLGGVFASLVRLTAGARYRVSATYPGATGYRPSWSG